MAYSPLYVNTGEVPVQVPDNYDKKEKNDALEVAESSLILDLNDGEPIPEADITPMMRTAIKQKATCELIKGADDPNSAKLGDLADGGTNKADYAQTFCDRYTEIVGKILDSGAFKEGEDTSPYVYTTEDPDS